MTNIYEMNQLHITILTEEVMNLRHELSNLKEENKALREKIDSSNHNPSDELRKRIYEIKIQTSDAYKKFDSLQRELSTKEEEFTTAKYEYQTLIQTTT
jgi:predicted  nucleic acid-binding Zn-ribbon protein